MDSQVVDFISPLRRSETVNIRVRFNNQLPKLVQKNVVVLWNLSELFAMAINRKIKS